ncbi:hypothetical protein K438DRAFT_1989649 [Mycena galopus ATCC 62051]|nr:hypothetical protein K438DRAFT_1989649 [Mycena galopus ATCC 62051]
MQPRRIENSRRRIPMCGLDVSVATGGMLYQRRCLRLYTRPPPSPLRICTRERLQGTACRAGSADAHMKPETRMQGDRPTLLLLGIQLGLDGVNLVYHETIKAYAVHLLPAARLPNLALRGLLLALGS